MSSRKELAEAAGWVARAIPDKPLIPVMAGMMIAEEDGQLTLGATDYDRTLFCTIPGSLGGGGRILVPGLALVQILRALRDDEILLTAVEGRLVLAGARTTVRLPLLKLEEYPQILLERPQAQLEVPAEELARMATRAVSFGYTGDDQGHPWQQATELKGSLTLTSGSPYSMIRQTLEGTGRIEPTLVQGSMLAETVTGFSGRLGVARVGQLYLFDQSRLAILRTLSLTMPDPSKLLDPGPVGVTVEGLPGALRLAGTLAEDVVLTWDETTMIVRAGSEDGEVVDELACTASEPSWVRLSIERAELLATERLMFTLDGRRMIVGTEDSAAILQGMRRES